MSDLYSMLHEDGQQGKVIMSYITDKNRLAIAFIDTADMELQACVQDVFGDDDLLRTLQSFKQQVAAPYITITNRLVGTHTHLFANAEDGRYSTSAGGAGSTVGTVPIAGGGDGSASANNVKDNLDPVRCLPPASFRFEAGMAMLDAVRIDNLEDHPTVAGRRLALQALINLEDYTLVRAIGGLLAFLESPPGRAVCSQPRDEGATLSIRAIRAFSLSNFVQITPVTFKALSIFSVDVHPSQVRGVGRVKEGFSLFALLDRTQSVIGQRTLRQWMMRPLLDPGAIAWRNQAVAQVTAAKERNAEVVKELQAKLALVRDIDRHLRRIHHVSATVSDWFAIMETVCSMNAAKVLVEAIVVDLHADALPGSDVTTVLTHILSVCDDELQWVQAMLHAVVDWQQTKADGRLSIRPGLHSTLDEYRQTHADLHGFLTKVAVHEMHTYPELPAAVVKYLPQIGFLLFVEHTAAVDLDGNPEFQRQYAVTDGTYFKTPRMLQLDEFFGDLASVIVDIEDDIVRQVSAALLVNRTKLSTCLKAFAELDCVQAMAMAAIDGGFVRPEIVDGTALYIQGGRHPIQEATVDQFIPNDTALAPEDTAGAVMVVTGPNFSGKSVYLKQVGLIAYMAHIGSFVPATRAVVGLIDRIFTRVNTEESVSAGQSTFTIDVQQAATMLAYATPRSLLLMDEFGKGTASSDGVALLVATIRYLLDPARGGTPKAVVTTHFQELFREDASLGTDQTGLYQMKVLVDDHGSMLQPEDATPGVSTSLVPLFKLCPGRSVSSFGIQCAAQAGMPHALLHRAVDVMAHITSGCEVPPVDAFL